MNTLLIRLEGPLQAWGLRARWSVRDTAMEPTKSGVVGLLACCLGWGTDDDTRIRALSRAFAFGVRADRPGRLLRDYHTVVGGVLSAERKLKITASTKEPETVVSERYYLCDASFLAALLLRPGASTSGPGASSGEEFLARCVDALQHPAWPPYLGRRSCPPALPLYAGIGQYDSLEEALADQPLSPEAEIGWPRWRRRRIVGGVTEVQAVVERHPTDRRGSRRPDEIESLVHRVYAPRYAEDVPVPVRVSGVAGTDRVADLARLRHDVDFWEDTL